MFKTSLVALSSSALIWSDTCFGQETHPSWLHEHNKSFLRGSSGSTDNFLGRHKSHHNSHGNSGSNRDEESDSSEFDFYVYSMTFQPEFCREHSPESFSGCRAPEKYWEGQLTIHGLWPNRRDGTWPEACTSQPLDTSPKSFLFSSNSTDPSHSIHYQLERKWPNVKSSPSSKSHTSFWEHEWSKHGTCSGLSQKEYFVEALRLLIPTPSIVKDSYGSTVGKDELIRKYGGPTLAVAVCNSNFLTEVRVCLEKLDSGRVGDRTECPSAILKEESCEDEIKIASFGMISFEEASDNLETSLA